jgi:hypothetical protein
MKFSASVPISINNSSSIVYFFSLLEKCGSSYSGIVILENYCLEKKVYEYHVSLWEGDLENDHLKNNAFENNSYPLIGSFVSKNKKDKKELLSLGGFELVSIH